MVATKSKNVDVNTVCIVKKTSTERGVCFCNDADTRQAADTKSEGLVRLVRELSIFVAVICLFWEVDVNAVRIAKSSNDSKGSMI